MAGLLRAAGGVSSDAGSGFVPRNFYEPCGARRHPPSYDDFLDQATLVEPTMLSHATKAATQAPSFLVWTPKGPR